MENQTRKKKEEWGLHSQYEEQLRTISIRDDAAIEGIEMTWQICV